MRNDRISKYNERNFLIGSRKSVRKKFVGKFEKVIKGQERCKCNQCATAAKMHEENATNVHGSKNT